MSGAKFPPSAGSSGGSSTPAVGSVVQVVMLTVTPAATISTTTTDYSAQVTGLSLSITPQYSTSKLIVRVTGGSAYCPTGNYMYTKIDRDGTLSAVVEVGFWQGAISPHSITAVFDATATTSTTFKLYYKGQGGEVDWHYDGQGHTPIVMTIEEIKQ